MGFFQSLKEDLSSSVNDMIGADVVAEETVSDEAMTFMDGEPLMSDSVADLGAEEMDGDFSSASYEQNIDDLLNTLKSISEENDAENTADQLLESIDEEDETASLEEQETQSEDIFSVRDALNSLKHASRKRDEQREEAVLEDNVLESVLGELSQDDNASAEEPEQLEFDFDDVLKATISEEAQISDDTELSEKIVAMAVSELEEKNEDGFDADEDIAVPVGSVHESEEAMVSVDDMPSVEGVKDLIPDDNGDPILSELLKEYQDKLSAEEASLTSGQEVTDMAEETKEDNTAERPDDTEEDEIQPVDTKPADSDLIYDEDEVSNDTAVITSGMSISGNINSNGNLDILGAIKGDIKIKGKLNVAGSIEGDSSANEIFVDGAEINGSLSANGSVKVGAGSVIIGDITARGAVIAGAVKGEIDVQGPVILDSSAIVMGNIKSMTVQINNGAVIEGLCSQCYAPVNPVSFFNELKK